jgi:hypothetical protein
LTKKKKVFLQYLPTARNIKIKITTDASTAEFSRHDIAEILLKVALSTNNQVNQSITCL